jgi:hypothetical protein
MQLKSLELDGIWMHESGLYLTRLTETSSSSGGPVRWLPTLFRFPDNHELLDLIEDVAEVVSNIMDTIEEEAEPDLYVEPETPFEIFSQEVEEWKKDLENYPAKWKLFKKNVDPETLALFFLDEEVKAKLVN